MAFSTHFIALLALSLTSSTAAAAPQPALHNGVIARQNPTPIISAYTYTVPFFSPIYHYTYESGSDVVVLASEVVTKPTVFTISAADETAAYSSLHSITPTALRNLGDKAQSTTLLRGTAPTWYTGATETPSSTAAVATSDEAVSVRTTAAPSTTSAAVTTKSAGTAATTTAAKGGAARVKGVAGMGMAGVWIGGLMAVF